MRQVEQRELNTVVERRRQRAQLVVGQFELVECASVVTERGVDGGQCAMLDDEFTEI